MSPLDRPTPESIQAARIAMMREREHVMRQFPGLLIKADGTIVLPKPKAHRPKRWFCEPCERWFMSRLDCPRCGCALLRAH